MLSHMQSRVLETRNVALENIVRSQKYPCVNRQSGCRELFSIEHIAKHHAVCVYGKIKCPLHLLKNCSWNGFKNDLKEHAKVAHPKYVFEGSTFHFPLLSESLAIVYYFREIFTCCLQKKDGRYYGAVQLTGTSNEPSKYKYEYTLRAANGIEQISNTFLVQGYSEDFETIFNSKKCLTLDEETINLFVADDKLNLIVTLSRV